MSPIDSISGIGYAGPDFFMFDPAIELSQNPVQSIRVPDISFSGITISTVFDILAVNAPKIEERVRTALAEEGILPAEIDNYVDQLLSLSQFWGFSQNAGSFSALKIDNFGVEIAQILNAKPELYQALTGLSGMFTELIDRLYQGDLAG
ncbi:MAG: hypothetical protein PHQ54_03485, partial [Candidatus Omnitrophica bacterium]|nr:hypothetical protein [Candidatus Omnitrophota bacterium]